MECSRTAHARARVATRILTLAFVWIAMLVGSFEALGIEAPAAPDRDAVLREAHLHQLRYRTGDLSRVPEYVAMLESASQAYPGDAEVWYALGVAYLAQAATALAPGSNPADAMAPMQKAPVALWKALRIDPEHAGAMAQLGGVQALLGPVLQRPRMLERGIAQMNRAVEMAPRSLRARLQRAFVGLSLPAEQRDPAAEAEDLDFLDAVSDLGLASDYVRLLRADLHAEQGEADAARALYRFVGETGADAPAAMARTRVALLAGGGVPTADILELRRAAGAQCAMCHGAP